MTKKNKSKITRIIATLLALSMVLSVIASAVVYIA